MKGLELPVNGIVIMAIAVLVMVTIAAFFVGQFGSGQDSIDTETAFIAGCSQLRSFENCRGDAIDDVRIANYGTRETDCTLATACVRKGLSTVAQCARACGCPAGDDASSLDATCTPKTAL